MELSKLYKQKNAEFAWYSIPASFELAGKCLEITYDDGEKTQLDFAAAPGLELSPGNGKTYPYLCAKIGVNRFFVSYIEEINCISLVIDTGEMLATRVIADATAKTTLSFGAVSSAESGNRHKVTDDFAGNAFIWSLGADATCVFKAEYGANSVAISLPLAGAGVPAVAASDFIAVKLAEGVYLQNATVTAEGHVFSIALASDFNNMLCAGGVFGVNNGDITHMIIGGYGCAAKQ